MNKTIQSPVFVLSDAGYQSEDIWFCANGFRRLMLPSWFGPLPKRIRFYIRPGTKPSIGVKWKWDGVWLQGSGGAMFLTNSLEQWLNKLKLKEMQCTLEMEIIEP